MAVCVCVCACRVVGYSYAYPSALVKYRLRRDEANEALIEYGMSELVKQLERLENGYLAKHKYLAGERHTVADSYVATVLLQAEWVGLSFRLWPRVEHWLRRERAQEFWGEVHAAHNQVVREVENAPFDV